MAGMAVFFSLMASLALSAKLYTNAGNTQVLVTGSQSERAADRDRLRRAAREQFSQNFRELQVLGIGLLKSHERGDLRPPRLSKDTKNIQKRAKTLRSLAALGEPLDPPEEYGSKLGSPEQFDKSIRELARLIHRFAHNPIHKNSKVFNMALASQASSDLVNIINLAKIIEDNANGYTPYAEGN